MLLAILLATALSNDLGDVSFPNSGAPAAQEPFRRGLALLHNFEYADAAEEFRKAQQADPSFAMAYWGEAMTYTHPVWFQQDAAAARAVLSRLGATAAERLGKAPTERERDYLRALDVLYGEGEKNDRDVRYSEAMAALHARYRDDVDATAFYALSLLGTAHEGRDFAIYMRAAALLEEVFPTHQRHPGVLHYLIHSYDDPVHAPLGMRPARLYGAIAPNAGHALHMTSHIFIAIGMWDDVIRANRQAIDVVNAQRAQRGKPPAGCGHYITWLHYAYLQLHRNDEARATLEACRASALTTDSQMSEYAMMRAHQVASGAAPDEASVTAKDDEGRFTIAYADALAAARRNDAGALRAARARMQSAKAGVPADAMPRGAADVMLQEVDALLLAASGKRDEAIALLRTAAAVERAMPFEFGPPAIPKPAGELLADQLLAAGRKSDAAAAYRAALGRTPGRAAAAEALRNAAAAER